MRSARRLALTLAAGVLLALASAGHKGDVPAPAQAQEPGFPSDFRQATSGAGAQMILQLQRGIEAPAAAGSPSLPSPAGAGGDVTVNNPGVDVPDSTTQSETTLAVRGSTICAGYNDSGAGGFSGFSRSTDRGSTWTDQGGVGQFGDPVLAVNQSTGTFYYAELAAFGGVSAIGVARSTDNCTSFSAPVSASPGGSAAAHFQDKPWIAVDNTGGARNGYIYVCWTRFVNNFPGPPTGGETRFSRSIDGGATFVNEQVISPGTDFYPFGCSVDVGPNGEVDVAWFDRSGSFPIRFRRSLDGGVTFPAPPVQVNSAPIRHPGIDRIVMCEGLRTTLKGDIRMLTVAWMAVDTTGGPFNGNIYLVWAHDPVGAVDNSDVYFSRSVDGGLSWTPEVQVGGGTVTDQFEPFVEVGGSGTVSIAWYDRRNDPANNFNIDVYKTFSRNGGATLDPIIRVTDVSFPVPPLLGQPTGTGQFDPGVLPCYMGEYIAIAADASRFYYAWGDNRNTVVSANYPAGRPDPDVFFDRQLDPQAKAVGGVAELADLAKASPEAARSSARSEGTLAGSAAAAVAFAVTLGGAAWYARRRRRP